MRQREPLRFSENPSVSAKGSLERTSIVSPNRGDAPKGQRGK